jgi:Tol biopolymer transport system component
MRIRLVIVTLAAALAVTASPAAAQDGLIVFESTRSGPLTELYTMRPDGSAVTRLTSNAVRDISAAWSRDGTQIAFGRGLRNWELFRVAADGSWEERLTATPENEVNPVWSPEDDRIAFERQSDRGSDIVVLDLDSREEQIVAGGSARPSAPAWSPDGSQLAYAVRSGRSVGVAVTDLDSGSTSMLSDTAADETAPAWSPGGDEIAFSRSSGAGSRLVVADAGGSGDERTVASGVRDAFSPAWAPSGDAIAFASQGRYGRRAEGEYAISRVDLATGAVQQLTASAPWRDVAPDWGPAAAASPLVVAPLARLAGPPLTFCTWSGTNAANSKYGSQFRSDVLCGKGGADVLRGRGNADTLKAGTGDDDLFGNGGSDDLITRGDGGGDFVHGGAGADEAWIDCSGDTSASALRRCG